MRINQLNPRSSFEAIDLVIVEKEETRGFISKQGIKGKVCNAVAKDETDTRIGLTLWNDDVDKVAVDDKVRISNGWVKEYNGQLQLSAGKFGKMDVLK